MLTAFLAAAASLVVATDGQVSCERSEGCPRSGVAMLQREGAGTGLQQATRPLSLLSTSSAAATARAAGGAVLSGRSRTDEELLRTQPMSGKVGTLEKEVQTMKEKVVGLERAVGVGHSSSETDEESPEMLQKNVPEEVLLNDGIDDEPTSEDDRGSDPDGVVSLVMNASRAPAGTRHQHVPPMAPEDDVYDASDDNSGDRDFMGYALLQESSRPQAALIEAGRARYARSTVTGKRQRQWLALQQQQQQRQRQRQQQTLAQQQHTKQQSRQQQRQQRKHGLQDFDEQASQKQHQRQRLQQSKQKKMQRQQQEQLENQKSHHSRRQEQGHHHKQQQSHQQQGQQHKQQQHQQDKHQQPRDQLNRRHQQWRSRHQQQHDRPFSGAVDDSSHAEARRTASSGKSAHASQKDGKSSGTSSPAAASSFIAEREEVESFALGTHRARHRQPGGISSSSDLAAKDEELEEQGPEDEEAPPEAPDEPAELLDVELTTTAIPESPESEGVISVDETMDPPDEEAIPTLTGGPLKPRIVQLEVDLAELGSRIAALEREVRGHASEFSLEGRGIGHNAGLKSRLNVLEDGVEDLTGRVSTLEHDVLGQGSTSASSKDDE